MDFDPTQNTVEQVREYVQAHPEDAAAVAAAEAARTDGTEPRKTVLALGPTAEAQTPTVVTTPQAPQEPPLPPSGPDAPPTAGNEPTGAQVPNAGSVVTTPTPPPVPEGTPPQPDPAEDELAAYYDRVDKLTADQRLALEAALDDGTAWDTMREDPIVRARFGAALTQAESQVTPATGSFVAPQDARDDDGAKAVQGSGPSEGQVYNEDGDTVSVADVRGEATAGGEAQPARGADADDE